MANYTTSSPVSSVAAPTQAEIVPLTGADPNVVKWGGALGSGVTVSYSFPWQNNNGAYWLPNYSTINEPSALSDHGLTTPQITAASAALQAWADVANIQFQKIDETPTSTTVGDIRFAWTSASQPGLWGWTYRPAAGEPAGGDIWISTAGSGAADIDWSVGSFNYEALMHEIGHALGLKHPGNYSGNEAPPFFSGSTAYLDNELYTLMAYSNPAKDVFRNVTYSSGTYHFTYPVIRPETPMVLDVAAMQYLYGANTTYHAGDDVYSFDPAKPFFKTIWDAGGNDTISVSNFSLGCTIDLTPGHYSSITILPDALPANYSGGTTPTYNGTNNLGIAYGTIIENAIGGAGNDTLIGNNANNTLTGGPSTDSLNGGSGTDTAVYAGARSKFSITKTTTGFTVTDTTGAEGTDTLTSIERMQFADLKLAFDMSGSAGNTAKLIRAAFGEGYLPSAQPTQQQLALSGAGIQLFDQGATMQQVAQAALDTALFAQIAGSTNDAAVVTTLYTDVVGTAPSPAEIKYYVGWLQGEGGTMSQADLLVFAANATENTQSIKLVGLANTGLGRVHNQVSHTQTQASMIMAAK
jgi:Ca2+-binding RTX toxin-like protein